MKWIYFFLSFIALYVSFQSSFSSSCLSGEICSCGSVVSGDSFLSGDLVCNNSVALEIVSGSLDCRGFSISFNGFNLSDSSLGDSTGILINGRNGVEVKNCVIENFSNGIYLKLRKKSSFYGYDYFPSLRTKIHNNSFRNNKNSIFLEKSQEDRIFNNSFYDIENSIYINSGSSMIYNNSFFSNYPFFRSTSQKYLCNNFLSSEIENFNPSANNSCSCILPKSGMYFDSKVNFCNGIYYNVSNINIVNNYPRIICNSTKFIGAGNRSQVFATISGAKDARVIGCDFENYNVVLNFSAVEKSSPATLGGSHKWSQVPYLGSFQNNSVRDSNFGVLYSVGDGGFLIKNNFFLNNNFSIFLNSDNALVYGNIFENSPIEFFTSYNSFCYNGIGNLYLGIKEEGCGCVVPRDGMVIKYKAKFCKGDYVLSKPIILKSKSYVNCNGASFRSLEESIFLLNPASNTRIENCILHNSKIGIKNNMRVKTGIYGTDYYYSTGNFLRNISFISLERGVYNVGRSFAQSDGLVFFNVSSPINFNGNFIVKFYNTFFDDVFKGENSSEIRYFNNSYLFVNSSKINLSDPNFVYIFKFYNLSRNNFSKDLSLNLSAEKSSINLVLERLDINLNLSYDVYFVYGKGNSILFKIFPLNYSSSRNLFPDFNLGPEGLYFFL